MKHHLRNMVRLLPLLAMLLTALAPSATFRASAQAPVQGNEVELVGVITAIDANARLTINDLVVDVSRAALKTPIVIGAIVKVEGTMRADGSLLAREVYSPEDDLQPGEIELIGILQSLSGTTAMVSGLGFNVAAAELTPGLTVGMLVKVHASLLPDGTWAASEMSPYMEDDDTATPDDNDNGNDNRIDDNSNDNDADDNGNDNADDRDDDGEDFRITGTLQEIGADYVVIEGLRIVTTDADLDMPLFVGTLVRAEVRLIGGALVASEVKSSARSDDSNDDSADDNNNDNGNDNFDDRDDNGNDNFDDDTVCTFKVESGSANLRSGPGTGYSVIGFAFEDDEFAVQQIHSSGAWVQVMLPNQTLAWVALSVGEIDDDCNGLPIATTPFRDDNGNDNDGDGEDDGNDNDGDGEDDGNDNEDDGDDDGNDNEDDGDDDGNDNEDDGDDDGNDNEDDGEDD